ncbi:uncharacterized protein LOC124138934 [Haliotis rufescens]|uniref:uncharacterized protein LOC124138934 n=1 Tax=Haliotis rufescens TaxID=6454 RepID=UPI001EB04852|nr:uncharacterized protein LOC124138934 [Haliotis rufescens]
MDAKLLLLFVSSAVLALSSGVSVLTTKAPDVVTPDTNAVAPAYYDGVDLNTLSDDELNALVDAEDEILKGELDIKAYLNAVADKPRLHKRWVPLARAAFSVGRSLFRSFSRGRVSRSGSRLTRQYNRQGNYGDAVRDFNRLSPSGTRPITGNNNLRGITGTMGRHRVTVRNTSSNGRPTLEIRSPNTNGGSTVRKFRYNP